MIRSLLFLASERIIFGVPASRRSIFVFRAPGPSDDGDSRKRGSYDASVWSVRSPEVSPASVDLRENFPDSPLAGENHKVILVDDGAHTQWAFPDH